MKKQHPVRGEVGRLKWFYWGFLYACGAVHFPWRATLLIFAIGPLLHAPFVSTFLVYIGYLICMILDQMAKDRRIEFELDGWEVDPDDEESETKGNLSRRRLAGENQIVTYRLATFLGRLP
jgi:hypothetical protein